MSAPRPCFVVLSHTEPDLVERLVRVLATEADHASVVVRHDQRRAAFDGARTRDLANVLVDSHHEDAAWGSWALTQRTVEAVVGALERDSAWDWLVLLSGQSYPLRPLASFLDDLAGTTAAAVMDLQPPAGAGRRGWRPFGADRARYRYRRLPGSPLWGLPAVQRPLLSLTGRQPWGGLSFHREREQPGRTVAQAVSLVRGSVFAAGAWPVKASQWWALRREAAEGLRPLLDPSSPWHQHFSRTWTSDELAVPSLLAAQRVAIDDRPLHAMRPFVEGSPAVLGMDDLPWLRSRDEPFARKVSLARDEPLVDAMDAARRAEVVR